MPPSVVTHSTATKIVLTKLENKKIPRKTDQNIPYVILKHQSNISIHHLLVWNFGGVCQILVQKAFSTDLSQLYPNIQSDYTKFLARNFPKHARMPANTVILLHKLLVSPFSKGLSYEMSGKPKTFRNSTSFPYVLFQNVNFSNWPISLCPTSYVYSLVPNSDTPAPMKGKLKSFSYI